jgi:hypothetical protein
MLENTDNLLPKVSCPALQTRSKLKDDTCFPSQYIEKNLIQNEVFRCQAQTQMSFKPTQNNI